MLADLLGFAGVSVFIQVRLEGRYLSRGSFYNKVTVAPQLSFCKFAHKRSCGIGGGFAGADTQVTIALAPCIVPA